MTNDDWHAGYARSLGVFLNGSAITEPGPRGEYVQDQDFLLLFNAHSETVRFTLPGGNFAAGWDIALDTAGAGGGPAAAGATIEVAGRAMMVLRGTAAAGEGGPA